jgi:uncharacterized membrane protein YeaQ/YmgE (transglycosylase-associated protein family)
MINLLLWLFFGALVGSLASILMGTGARLGLLFNIVVGIVGAFLGGVIFNLVGISGATINDTSFSLSSLLVSFVGAVVLLVIFNTTQRSRVRYRQADNGNLTK